jgi:hypothetical protein
MAKKEIAKELQLKFSVCSSMECSCKDFFKKNDNNPVIH